MQLATKQNLSAIKLSNLSENITDEFRFRSKYTFQEYNSGQFHNCEGYSNFGLSELVMS